MKKEKEKIENCIIKNRQLEVQLISFLKSSYNMTFNEFFNKLKPAEMIYPLTISGGFKSLFIEDATDKKCIVQLYFKNCIVLKYSTDGLEFNIVLSYIDNNFEISSIEVSLPNDASFFIDSNSNYLKITCDNELDEICIIFEDGFDILSNEVILLCFSCINIYNLTRKFDSCQIKKYLSKFQNSGFIIID